jgi:His/Glu/Gln/Arg/opine family amino acid ABC transporter permease subunit
VHLHFGHVWKSFGFILWGASHTVEISLLGFALALLIAYAVGIARAQRLPRWASPLLTAYVELFRGTPLLVQLFIIYYGLWQVGIVMNAWTAGVIGLGLNSGAYMSEVVRSSILAIDQGQVEAADALGYGRRQALWHIVLPQATRIAIPPLTNSLASLLKESSLVSIIAITELMRVGNIIYSRTMAPFEIYITLAAIYLVMTSAVTLVSRRLERANRRWSIS